MTKLLTSWRARKVVVLAIAEMNMTFSQIYETSNEELRYRLDERAAIHEFDGGLSLEEAEKRTAEAYSRAKSHALKAKLRN